MTRNCRSVLSPKPYRDVYIVVCWTDRTAALRMGYSFQGDALDSVQEPGEGAYSIGEQLL